MPSYQKVCCHCFIAKPGQPVLCREVRTTTWLWHQTPPSRPWPLLRRALQPFTAYWVFPPLREKGLEYQTEPWMLVRGVQTGSGYALVGLSGSLQVNGLSLATMLVRTMWETHSVQTKKRVWLSDYTLKRHLWPLNIILLGYMPCHLLS